MNLWQLIKDVLLVGTGILVILSQVIARHPSDVLLATGLALTVPSIAGHTASLLGGATASRTSRSSPPHGPPPSGPQPEAPGEPK